MTRAVVVDTDPARAQRHAAALRSVGYEVETCGGPGVEPCPVVGRLPCPLVDRADVLIFDARVAGEDGGGSRLVADLRDLYVDLPLILTSVDPGLDWVETEGRNRVTPLAGDPGPEQLLAAVEVALADQAMAV
jgi:hypothetical protein